MICPYCATDLGNGRLCSNCGFKAPAKYVLEIPTRLSLDAVRQIQQRWQAFVNDPYRTLLVLGDGCKLTRIDQ